MPRQPKTPATGALAALQPSAGLCATCGNARIVEAQTGSKFYRCQLAAGDRRYAKYPRIPVLRCEGYSGPRRFGSPLPP